MPSELDLTAAWPRSLRRMLAHVEQCGDELRRAAGSGAPEEWHVPMFAFAIAAYHLAEWVERLGDVKASPVRNSRGFQVCRDFANAAKHGVINLDHRAQRERPPIVEEASYSATAVGSVTVATAGWEELSRNSIEYMVPRVIMTDGTSLKVVEIVDAVVNEWRRFYDEHGLSRDTRGDTQ
jgi:hypothetical protein